MKKEIKLNLATFDLVKGIALIGIVLGHMFSHYDTARAPGLVVFSLPLFLLRTAINPMFLIASGFGFRPKPMGKMLKKTASELLKPYGYVTLAVAILFPLVHFLFYRWWPGAVQEGMRYLLAFLLGIPKTGKTVLGIPLYECSIMWFFLSLFWGLNLLNGILKLKREWTRLAAVAACAVLGYGLMLLDFNFFCIPQGLMAVGCCYTGYLLKQYKLYTGEKTHLWLYLALAAATLWQAFFGDFNLAHGIFRYGLFDYIGAVCAGALLLILGIHMSAWEWKGLDGLRKVGVYSYWILCIHSVELVCIPWYTLTQVLAEHQVLAFLLEATAKGLLYGAGCFVLKRISRQLYKRRIKRSGKQKLH